MVVRTANLIRLPKIRFPRQNTGLLTPISLGPPRRGVIVDRQRRLFSFLLTSSAFLFVYMGLRLFFDVQPPVPEGAEAPGVQAIAEADADSAPSRAADAPAEDAAGSDSGEASDADETAPAVERPSKQSWVTLGSMSEESPYYMLVTLTNRGSGLERIELTERNENGRFKYRRVDTRSGYLGYFAGRPSALADGVRVNVVGDGTPAALATMVSGEDQGKTGVRVDDILVAVAGVPIVTDADIERALSSTKPGDEVTVEVLRPTDGELSPLELKATLSEHPLDLVRLASAGGTEQIAGNLSRLSCLLKLQTINRRSIPAGETNIQGVSDLAALLWEFDADEDLDTSSDGTQSATFRLPMSADDMGSAGQSLQWTRAYALSPGMYDIDMSVQIKNTSSEAQDVAYRLEGLNGVTLEGWWYSNKISPNWGGAAARDVIYKTPAGGHDLVSGYNLLKQAKNEPASPRQSLFAPDSVPDAKRLEYIGIDAQYFVVAYVPPENGELTGYQRATAGIVATPNVVPDDQERAVNVSFTMDSQVATLPAGSTLREDLKIFAGPKRPELLSTYSLDACIEYGWFWFVAQPLGKLLHFFFAIIGNYAVAIVLLTLVVRGLMFPFSRKAAINAQKMQELAPEMKKIAEKYKDDMEGRLTAQRQLQQRVGFNPLAGCAPMFLQLPIFIGLYRSLSVDIELRQAGFASWTSWASNLAGPDMFTFWGDWLWGYLSGRGTGWLGPYFNILPVIVMGLFLAQQKLFMPPATDEQTAMTQKIMSYMTLVMGLFFFRVPAGLCIYFITSSLWGICERIFVKKTLPKGNHFDSAVLEGVAEKPASKSKTIADRLRDQLTPPEQPAELPNKRKRPVVSGKNNGRKKR
ncbi:MAG: membrane protein insertase YidC [Planctomycetota bacterium]